MQDRLSITSHLNFADLIIKLYKDFERGANIFRKQLVHEKLNLRVG